MQILAGYNGLGVGEFINYVYWCFDNPRTNKETKRNMYIPSLSLWEKNAIQIKQVQYYTRRGSAFFFKFTIEKQGNEELLKVKTVIDDQDNPIVVGFQSRINITEREIDDIKRIIFRCFSSNQAESLFSNKLKYMNIKTHK
ncbi:hypothetical protein [Brevibacillus sp. SYSU BS000544]|uniref:hypothetical protein n=1 Tax=Brevibacillus sp. SYSU BS000544 TaxID=3416443 RepID=UPI003CE4F863